MIESNCVACGKPVGEEPARIVQMRLTVRGATPALDHDVVLDDAHEYVHLRCRIPYAYTQV